MEQLIQGTLGITGLLEVLIGFSAVMLLLSLIVTTLVQGTQYLLKLRGRTLRRSLESLLKEAWSRTNGSTCPDETVKSIVNTILTSQLLVPFKVKGIWSKRPFSWFAGAANECTWIELGEFVSLLQPELEKARDCLPAVRKDILKTVQNWFPRMEANQRDRFLFRVRAVTLIWAVVVALVFQLSTPTLLQRLWSDDAMRKQYSDWAITKLLEKVEQIGQLARFQDVSTEAIDELKSLYPEHSALLGEAVGQGATREEIVGEVSQILGETANRQEVVAKYEELLNGKYRDRISRALEIADYSVRDLSVQGIELWPFGMEYYWRGNLPRLDKIGGVLLTAILIGLGAPFWFNTLKKLVNFKDVFAQRREEKELGEQEKAKTVSRGRTARPTTIRRSP